MPLLRPSLFLISCFSGGISLAALALNDAPQRAERPLVEAVVAVESGAPVGLPEVVQAEDPGAACDDGAIDPTQVMSQLAWELSTQHIGYNAEPLSDCSGILHRLLEGLRDRCDGSFAPEPVEARSARDLASWYQGHGLLIPTPELGDLDRWLVPGAITFYTSPRRRDVANIIHTAVVVDVQRDELGRVQALTLFHGRQPGKVASFTSNHRRDSDQPLGNGDHALFAIAYPHPAIARAAPALADGLADASDGWTPGL